MMNNQTQIATCNHMSVGIIVWHPSRNFVLLQERTKLPYGIAAPAGHVELGETYEDAAVRELKEETGLQVAIRDLELVYEGMLNNACRRPTGAYHNWKVYETVANGVLDPCESEVYALGWYSLRSLQRFASRTYADPVDNDTKLEQVWYDLFSWIGLHSA